ncbi:MAG: hypothetical protein U5R31_05440 [Acidimicrobiia bacterium]|nr:hypothetical protein [Acidimicrobiia bacterium]
MTSDGSSTGVVAESRSDGDAEVLAGDADLSATGPGGGPRRVALAAAAAVVVLAGLVFLLWPDGDDRGEIAQVAAPTPRPPPPRPSRPPRRRCLPPRPRRPGIRRSPAPWDRRPARWCRSPTPPRPPTPPRTRGRRLRAHAPAAAEIDLDLANAEHVGSTWVPGSPGHAGALVVGDRRRDRRGVGPRRGSDTRNGSTSPCPGSVQGGSCISQPGEYPYTVTVYDGNGQVLATDTVTLTVI